MLKKLLTSRFYKLNRTHNVDLLRIVLWEIKILMMIIITITIINKLIVTKVKKM